MDIRKKESFVRKILFLAILCALLAPLHKAQALRHASQGVTVTAKAGFRGFCKSDDWLPIHVTVENTGADIDARVQASYTSGGRQIFSAADISLPATSRKEFFLYIMPESFMSDFTVSVLDGGNKSLAKTNLNINCTEETNLLVGVLADTPSNYVALNNIEPMTGETQVAQLELSDLPDLAQGWDILDALVISNVDTGTLTSEQKQALELWLTGGGRLFVTGGIQWQPTAAGLGDLLPLQPTSTKKTALSSLPAYTLEADTVLEGEAALATGKLQAGANVLVEQNGSPLLVEKEIGFGKVYYFAADPALQPLNDWDGMKKIYEHLLAFKSPKPSWADGSRDSWDNYQAGNALAALPELSLPSFVYICCWLGLYIVIIGPVNYFVLRRAKRTELAWVTVPALVIIFTCLAYFWGYAYRGTKPILNRIMLTQGWQGVTKTRNTALVGVYSPNRTTYEVESRENFLISPYPNNEDLQGNGQWLSIKTDSGFLAPDIRVEIGGMKSLKTDGYLSSAISLQHDLTYILSDKTPALKGSIANTGGLTLKDVVIVTSSGWQVLGELAPGDSQKINLILSNPNSVNSSGYALTSDIGWDTYTFDNVEERRRSSFFRAVISSYNGNFSSNGGVYLMAWVEEKVPAPVTLRDREPNVTDTMLHIEKLTPTLEVKPGAIMLNSSVYGWASSLGSTVVTDSYNLPSGGYNIDFRPSVPIHHGEISSLKLNIGTNNNPQQIHPSIWNFQTDAWQALALDLYGSVEIPDAWQCVGMGGEVLINIQGDQNNYFDITSVDFIMTVQP